MTETIEKMKTVTDLTLSVPNYSSISSGLSAELLTIGVDNQTSTGGGGQSSEASPGLQEAISIIVPILFALIVIVGLIGNSLVVIVVKCNPQMFSTTNLLIINLAIADLLFIVFCVPFTAWDYAFSFWPFGNIWCKVVQYLIVVCAYASIYTLVLMSLDRYLAVAHPIRSMSLRTIDNANRAILIMWIVIILFCIPTAISHNVLHGYYGDNLQYSVCSYASDNWALYQVSFFLFSYIIPIFIIIVLYILMLKRLWFGAMPGRNMNSDSVRKKKVTRMVVIVVIIFACCWCPIQVVLVLRSFSLFDNTSMNIAIQIVGNTLAYMNSCVNPILYAFLSENFRKAFRRVIWCDRFSKRTPDQTAADNHHAEQELTIGMCQKQETKPFNGGNNDV